MIGHGGFWACGIEVLDRNLFWDSPKLVDMLEVPNVGKCAEGARGIPELPVKEEVGVVKVNFVKVVVIRVVQDMPDLEKAFLLAASFFFSGQQHFNQKQKILARQCFFVNYRFI